MSLYVYILLYSEVKDAPTVSDDSGGLMCVINFILFLPNPSVHKALSNFYFLLDMTQGEQEEFQQLQEHNLAQEENLLKEFIDAVLSI